ENAWDLCVAHPAFARRGLGPAPPRGPSRTRTRPERLTRGPPSSPPSLPFPGAPAGGAQTPHHGRRPATGGPSCPSPSHTLLRPGPPSEAPNVFLAPTRSGPPKALVVRPARR